MDSPVSVLKNNCFGAVVSVLALVVFEANAATVTTNNATWPTDPEWQTVDCDTVGSSANVDFGGQSFQVDTTFTVARIYVQLLNYNGSAFTITIYEIADYDVNPWVLGTEVTSISVGAGTSFSGDGCHSTFKIKL